MDRPIASPPRAIAGHPWWLILGLVGVDYFSTLAYLPAMALASAGPWAPWAAVLVVLVTLLLALPIYAYVVGRSPTGQGATGLIERTIAGWRGKVLVLVLMGFIAADFVITRSLSTADAAVHVLANPHWSAAVDTVAVDASRLHELIGPRWAAWLAPYWNKQVGVTLAILAVAILFWWVLARGFTRRVVWLAAGVTACYLAINAVLLGGLFWGVAARPELLERWWDTFPVQPHHSAARFEWFGMGLSLLALLLFSFPQMALGISGYELSMSLAPLVASEAKDDVGGRVARTRWLLLCAALLMGLFLVPAVLLVTLLVPPALVQDGGPAAHRALAYLAHGGQLTTGRSATDLFPLAGPAFGTVYDAATVIILCLAGVSVMISLRDLVPKYLHRMGMELTWAARFGLIIQVFNVIILLVTLVFRASVAAQEWAYSTSVQVLLAGAALAALADLWKRWSGYAVRPLVVAPVFLVLLFFLGTVAATVWHNYSGVLIALAFVAALLVSSFLSRWLRSTELRFQGFAFADAATAHRWEQICKLDFQVLVPHRPGKFPLSEKNAEIRRKHRLPEAAHLIFIEVELGDPSDFTHQPLMSIENDDGLEVIRLSKAVSVAHVLAAVGLEFRRVGLPPEIIFGWSHESPLAANLNFLLLGEGNVPWMVQQLVRHAEPKDERRPRIVIG